MNMQDIHDIRPPVVAGLNPGILDILLIALCVAAAAAIIWFLYRLYKKKGFHGKKKKILMLPPPPPARDIALDELENISRLIKKSTRLFYFRLTAILKNYMARIFSINAREMTSQELIKAINTLDIDGQFLIRISRFLEFSDTIKYAAMPATLEKVENDLKLVKEFVYRTSKEEDE